MKGRQAHFRPDGAVAGSLTAVMDISGPLPNTPAVTLVATGADAEGARRPRRAAPASGMADLPRELDPFECDWPWTGWTEPKHRAVIRAGQRSATFERDRRWLLAIFAA